MNTLAAKYANSAKVNDMSQVEVDVYVSDKMCFLNKSFSSRHFAYFAAKKVCLS